MNDAKPPSRPAATITATPAMTEEERHKAMEEARTLIAARRNRAVDITALIDNLEAEVDKLR
jgi:hypothetical protein